MVCASRNTGNMVLCMSAGCCRALNCDATAVLPGRPCTPCVLLQVKIIGAVVSEEAVSQGWCSICATICVPAPLLNVYLARVLGQPCCCLRQDTPQMERD
jgi:hypothetical protein